MVIPDRVVDMARRHAVMVRVSGPDPSEQKTKGRAFFNASAHAAERGRYGLGAGPTPAWL